VDQEAQAMSDYRLMYDAEYLHACHLGGRTAVVTIARVTAVELIGEKGRKSKKPAVHFKGKALPLAINRTNGKAIAALFGTDTAKWIGKSIAIYPTTTEMGGKVCDCIRVKPQAPAAPSAAQEEPGANG
jgi:hypothetical protein